MRNIVMLCTVLLFSFSSFSQQINIIPKPASLQVKPGNFIISKKTVIAVNDEEDTKAADFLNDYLQDVYGFKLNVDKQASKNYIRLSTKNTVTDSAIDSYSLNVIKEGVTIEGATHIGTFYGIQSLIQLLPVIKNTQLVIKAVAIQDAPRFAYRGMHLDVGRHFFPVSFVKKYIDYLALHKMNYFHWHLTEDQGWRIEIKKYPRLTEVGAYRKGTIIGHYPGTGNDSIPYGGFYTQDEIKEVVQYAADRYITIIPEIEMPGHAEAALTSYPWLGCPGTGPYKVEETWGVFDNVFCAGNDSTFMFLQDVLDEVMTLFPSKYIHIGGDECPKTNWKKCPLCQARIKAEGLKDEHELQSYFIQRIEKYLNSKGRQIIGWDEILEGGLAPKATVMSWRGEEGGIAAAQQHHKVIMTPGTYVYFDHSQSTKEDSVTIGGYLPLQTVYNYEPIPKELNAEEAKYIMGAQANVWTEYMAYPSKVEYMIFPRMSALSEVLWTAPEKKSWSDFQKRLPAQFKRYDLWKVHYSNAYYDINYSILPSANYKGILIKMETNDSTGKLLYAESGKHYPKNYTTPILVKNTEGLTGMYYKGTKLMDSITINVAFNKATGKKITLAEPPAKYYPGNGAFTLVDGIQNTAGVTHAKEFIGYKGTDLAAIIDLGSAQSISQVIVHAISKGSSQVYPPKSVEVLASTDGTNFKSLATSDAFVQDAGPTGNFTINFDKSNTRYVKVVVHPLAAIPEGKKSAGEQPWMFIDEIEVN